MRQGRGTACAWGEASCTAKPKHGVPAESPAPPNPSWVTRYRTRRSRLARLVPRRAWSARRPVRVPSRRPADQSSGLDSVGSIRPPTEPLPLEFPYVTIRVAVLSATRSIGLSVSDVSFVYFVPRGPTQCNVRTCRSLILHRTLGCASFSYRCTLAVCPCSSRLFQGTHDAPCSL